MTQEDKKEFVRKIQNNTQPKPIGIKSMIAQQKKIIADNKIKKERDKLENFLPKEISSISIIHSNRKKMSSKKCLEKHKEKVQMRKDREEKKENIKIIIIKKDRK